MNKLRLLILLLLLTGLAWPAQPLSAQEKKVVTISVAEAKAMAAAHLSQDEIPQAYDLYARLLRLSPSDPEVNLGLARAAFKAGRYNQSVMAYERAMEISPNDPAIKSEALNVYQAVGDKLQLASQTGRLKEMDPSRRAEAVRQAMASSNTTQKLFQYSGKVRFGAMYDSNANQGPASNLLNIGVWNVEIPGSQAKSSSAAYLSGNLSLSRRFDQASRWWVVGDVSANIRGNFNNELKPNGNRGTIWARGAVGLRYLSKNILWDFRLKSEMLDYEFEQQIDMFGPEMSLIYAPRKNIQFITNFGMTKRDYSYDNTRNGYYGSVSESFRYFFGEKLKNHATASVRYSFGDAERRKYDYDGWEGSLRLNYKVLDNWELTPAVAYGKEKYKGPATALETADRQDETWRYSLGLNVPINEKWAVEVFYQYTKNDSECDLYDYDRHLVSTGLVWSF